MKVLITGGNGYIARSLTKALESKYELTCIGRSDFDLRDSAATAAYFEGKYFDVVIHTAIVGGSRLRPDTMQQAYGNILMYYNLMDNSDHFGRFINFGSGAEITDPVSPYGLSKRTVADLMKLRDNCLNLRIYGVFDENELDSRFIKANITRYLNQEDMVIYRDKFMDFFYMKDLITLVEHHLDQPSWLLSEIDCVYVDKYTLTDIAGMINKLGKHVVGIDVIDSVDSLAEKDYTGLYRGLVIPLVGLEQGIREVYHKLVA